MIYELFSTPLFFLSLNPDENILFPDNVLNMSCYKMTIILEITLTFKDL